MTEILIVEDVPEMREWLSSLVEARYKSHFPGLKITQAASAIELRRKLERSKPSLILLDEVLGVDTGEDLASILPALMTYRVVLMSGMESPLYETRALPGHVLGRILKPNWDQGSGEERFFKALEELLTDLG
jgi:CheY-like chemotaxis protein